MQLLLASTKPPGTQIIRVRVHEKTTDLTGSVRVPQGTTCFCAILIAYWDQSDNVYLLQSFERDVSRFLWIPASSTMPKDRNRHDQSARQSDVMSPMTRIHIPQNGVPGTGTE